jgi:filamentous hemagglutinin family protein
MGKKVVFLSGVSVIALGVASAMGSGLPTSGKFTSGKGSISTSGTSMTVKQSSTSGIIDWKTFSVGAPNSIAFNNGSGVTLNKVTGKNLSTIAGSITATGSIYLMNSQGVIVSGTGKIVTGGTFIATSGGVTTDTESSNVLDIAKAKKKVTNAGSIISSSGNVFLVGNSVVNTGTITAKTGAAAVVAASQMKLSLVSQPPMFGSPVQQTFSEAGKGNASNSGDITGATVEVTAFGGNVSATTTTKAGTLTALGNGENDPATIWVVSQSGKITISANLSAVNKDKTGGYIELQGYTLSDTGTINAGANGLWHLLGHSILVDSQLGNTISTALNAGTNVELDSQDWPDGSGQTVEIDAPITWSTNATLDVYVGTGVVFDKSVKVTGAGNVYLAEEGFLDETFNDGSSLNFGTKNKGATFHLQGHPYTLIYNLRQLQNINNDLTGDFALATSLDASGVSNWVPIGTDGNGTILNGQKGLTGDFDGLGHTVSNLTIDLPSAMYVGLFGYSSGSIRDVGVIGGSVTGLSYVGGLAGAVDGVGGDFIEDDYSTATVIAGADGDSQANAGGLLGWTGGGLSIMNDYATGSVSSDGGNNVGGLVGINGDPIANSYATGAVSGNDFVGGLVGANTADGDVSYSFSTGFITASGQAGGLIGQNGTANTIDSYWDAQTSGQKSSQGGDALTTAQLEQALPTGFSSSVWGIEPKKSMPYLLWQAPNTGTRPKTATVTAAPSSDDLLTDETKRWRG